MYLLLSSFMQFQMKKEMNELRQQKIGLEKLRSLRVPPVPGTADQDDALEKIRAGFEEARQMKAKIASIKAEIDAILRTELGTPAFGLGEPQALEAEDSSQEEMDELEEETFGTAA